MVLPTAMVGRTVECPRGAGPGDPSADVAPGFQETLERVGKESDAAEAEGSQKTGDRGTFLDGKPHESTGEKTDESAPEVDGSTGESAPSSEEAMKERTERPDGPTNPAAFLGTSERPGAGERGGERADAAQRNDPPDRAENGPARHSKPDTGSKHTRTGRGAESNVVMPPSSGSATGVEFSPEASTSVRERAGKRSGSPVRAFDGEAPDEKPPTWVSSKAEISGAVEGRPGKHDTSAVPGETTGRKFPVREIEGRGVSGGERRETVSGRRAAADAESARVKKAGNYARTAPGVASRRAHDVTGSVVMDRNDNHRQREGEGPVRRRVGGVMRPSQGGEVLRPDGSDAGLRERLGAFGEQQVPEGGDETAADANAPEKRFSLGPEVVASSRGGGAGKTTQGPGQGIDAQAADAAPAESVGTTADRTTAAAEASLSPAGRARSSDVMQEAVVRQARMVREGQRSEMTIELEPPKLGKMKVEVAMENESLKVQIQVENAELRDALRNDLQDLQRMLRESHPGSHSASVSDFWSDENARGRRDDQSAERRQLAEALGAEMEAPEGTVGWVRTTETGRIDCLI